MMQKMNLQNNTNNIPDFIFFGGPEISVDFLNILKESNTLPGLIVTTPDKPAGRKLVLTPPPLKLWADENNIPVIQPRSLKKNFDLDHLTGYSLFVVVAYGKIIPQAILDLPEHGSINLHPSLLPKYRGPSPIITAILNDDKETGFSLMLLDAEMDHGPLIHQQVTLVREWKKNRDMEKYFAKIGATLFLEVIPEYISGNVTPQEQDHDQATECSKFTKADMQIDPTKPREAYLKYCAFDKPFFFYQDTRIIVTDAEWKNDDFVIKKIVPAGKKETDWRQYKESRQ